MEHLSITTIPVTIKVLEVGGKRLTLSVFRQIPEDFFFGDDISDEQRAAWYLGWVDYNGKWLLFSRDGILVKDRFDFKRENIVISGRYSHSKKNIERMRADPTYMDGKWGNLLADNERRHNEIYEEWRTGEEKRMAWNKQYQILMTNDKQIYIAI